MCLYMHHAVRRANAYFHSLLDFVWAGAYHTLNITRTYIAGGKTVCFIIIGGEQNILIFKSFLVLYVVYMKEDKIVV